MVVHKGSASNQRFEGKLAVRVPITKAVSKQMQGTYNPGILIGESCLGTFVMVHLSLLRQLMYLYFLGLNSHDSTQIETTHERLCGIVKAISKNFLLGHTTVLKIAMIIY